MKIILVRHGEIDNAYLKCYNGHNNIGLSEKGEREAHSLAEHFKEQAFDAVYCSDLLRARATLAPFALGTSPCYTKKLREKSWGRHEGMTFEAICARDGLVYEDFEQWVGALDGEAHDAYIERIRRFFLEELSSQPHEQVLVMTHAGVIRVLYAITQSLSLEAAFSLPFPYASYVTYDLGNNSFGELQCVC